MSDYSWKGYSLYCIYQSNGLLWCNGAGLSYDNNAYYANGIYPMLASLILLINIENTGS